jgi:hypothetical protein
VIDSVENIGDSSNLYAVVMREFHHGQGLHFVTSETHTQQIGYMSYGAGYKIQAHTHSIIDRTISRTTEVLYVKSGKVLATIYTEEKKFFKEIYLLAGDFILLLSGGHGFEVIEDSVIIEIKQGPYLGLDDKVKF